MGNLNSLRLTAKAPENGWLEYDRFLLGPGLFSGAFAVSFREGSSFLGSLTHKSQCFQSHQSVSGRCEVFFCFCEAQQFPKVNFGGGCFFIPHDFSRIVRLRK